LLRPVLLLFVRLNLSVLVFLAVDGGVLADSFSLVASVPLFIRIFEVFVCDGVGSLGGVAEVFS